MAARQKKLSRKSEKKSASKSQSESAPKPKFKKNKGNKRPTKMRWYLLLWVLAVSIALFWSIKPSLDVIYAASKLPSVDMLSLIHI